MRDVALYTAARLALFAGAFAASYAVADLLTSGPVPVLWPLLAGAVLSTALSLVLLRGLRDRVSARLDQRASRMSQRFEEMRAKEDVD